MSLVNQNKSSEVISAAESLELCRVRTCTFTDQYVVNYISETKKTSANVVCVCIVYPFFCFRFYNLLFFFVFLKFQISKDMLAFYHLSRKLNCMFV